MATVWINEIPINSTFIAGAFRNVVKMPPITTQTVAITDTSAQSSAFNGSAGIIELYADAACHLAFGADPTATTSSMAIGAGERVCYAVEGGHKVAVIEAA